MDIFPRSARKMGWNRSSIWNMAAPRPNGGRLIFHVADVDGFWAHFKEKGLHPESPRDASWGERCFPMCDPDGHELSFAQPI